MFLWIYSKFKNRISSSHRRKSKLLNLIQRASFCIWSNGSYTLEAAVIIPLIAMYLVTILSFFLVLDIQCTIDEALLYTGRKVAVESSVVESEELLFISAEAYMQRVLRENPRVEKYLQHGLWGVHLWKSDFCGDEIYLNAEYIIELPISFWGVGELKLSSQNCFQKWRGDQSYQTEDEMQVYVTTYGTVYHANLSCRAIQLSVKACTIESISYLRGKNGQCYYECNRCRWMDSQRERVYYTDYGTLYHKDIACSAIKRMVEKINIENIGDRSPCNFCYGL